MRLVDLMAPVSEAPLNEFKISVSRIEMVARDVGNEEVRVTFNFERPPITFQISIFVGRKDFDDTEMVRVARNELHRIFAELASQCENWSLSSTELKELANMNLRPTTPTI
jgi:hypothetical protein